VLRYRKIGTAATVRLNLEPSTLFRLRARDGAVGLLTGKGVRRSMTDRSQTVSIRANLIFIKWRADAAAVIRCDHDAIEDLLYRLPSWRSCQSIPVIRLPVAPGTMTA